MRSKIFHTKIETKALCKNGSDVEQNNFQIQSGSFETLIKLADEGLGTTLLPYLHTLDLKEKDKLKLRHFKEPRPAREVSLIFPKKEKPTKKNFLNLFLKTFMYKG